MVTVALRAVGWPAIFAVTAVAVALGVCGVVFLDPARPELLVIAFALLAAAAAFTLDEPASSVVDVTPTGPAARTALRSLALLVPLGAGLGLVLACAFRAPALSWAAIALALAGNVLLGFAIACVARRRTGEPGAWASSAVAFVLIMLFLVPALADRVQTFPTTAGASRGLSSNAWWGLAGGACVVAITVSVSGLTRGKRPGRSGGRAGLADRRAVEGRERQKR